MLLTLAVGSAFAAESPVAPVASGQGIYRDGVLASGESLQAERDRIPISGKAAACVNCHRRSGLGGYEGSILIPPIIGPYLFREQAENTHDLNLPHVIGYSPSRYAYDAGSLGTALRKGIAPDGRSLNALMPRYSLSDANVTDIAGYLTRLSAGPQAGVSAETLEFATVVAADADAGAAEAMIKIIQGVFTDHNVRAAPRIPSSGSTGATGYRSEREWRLHVWRLSGLPEEWPAQLERLAAARPVFAVLSGIGRATWAPVERFCEQHQVPCILPNVDLPPGGEGIYYSVYFSRGVLLEADLILSRLLQQRLPGDPPINVTQVYREGDIGAIAARKLAEGARDAGITAIDRPLPPFNAVTARSASPAAAADIKAALKGIDDRDTLILWLRPTELAGLVDVPPQRSAFLSGTMAGLDNAPLPLTWRHTTLMTYPFDPPQRRRFRENFAHAWLERHGLDVVDDRIQSDTYLACNLLSETLDSMLDAYVPDFLIERLEMMATRHVNSGYFPRIALGPGQRFASKGGYVVRVNALQPAQVSVEGEWMVP